MNTKEKIFIDNIEKINKMISENRPKSEISRMLGMKYETMNGYFKKYGINYKGNPHRTGFVHEESRIPLDKILNNEIVYSASSLKKRLIEEGIKEYKCENPECGISEWNGKELPLELHHIDGNHYNNNLSNLQLLCPNCHAQTEFFRGRKKKKNNVFKNATSKKNNTDKNIKAKNKEKKYCKSCGNEIIGKNSYRKQYCSPECYHKSFLKFDVSKEQLINDFKKLKTYVSVGKKYGVSDKAIKKRVLKFGILDDIKK